MRSGLDSFQFPKSSSSLYAHIWKEKTTWDIVEETPKKPMARNLFKDDTVFKWASLPMERFPSLFFQKSNVCVKLPNFYDR